VSPPLEGVTRGGPPLPLVTPLGKETQTVEAAFKHKYLRFPLNVNYLFTSYYFFGGTTGLATTATSQCLSLSEIELLPCEAKYCTVLFLQ